MKSKVLTLKLYLTMFCGAWGLLAVRMRVISSFNSCRRGKAGLKHTYTLYKVNIQIHLYHPAILHELYCHTELLLRAAGDFLKWFPPIKKDSTDLMYFMKMLGSNEHCMEKEATELSWYIRGGCIIFFWGESKCYDSMFFHFVCKNE